MNADVHLWSVPERTHENDENDANVEVQEDFKHGLSSTSTEKVECVCRRIRRSR